MQSFCSLDLMERSSLSSALLRALSGNLSLKTPVLVRLLNDITKLISGISGIAK